jgi:MFS family permease
MTVSEISQVEIAHVRKGMTGKEKQVVFAASLGTIFEVYDFFLMGLLANEIARNFFSGVNPTAGFIFTLLGWAAGFLLRPFGALVFGRLGDLVGRKYTFLVTIVLMGGATCIIGLLPGYSSIGIGAPIVLITLRMLQGIAFGGEFGGAMIYVAEHAPNEQRGAWTAWIISTAALGFLLAFAVITPARYLIGDTDFMAWGWRVPFLLSSILLAFSLWIRLKLDESPEFKKMKEQGAGSKAPISETFGQWKHLKPVLIALFGIVPGQAVVWYTGQFYTLFFLTRVLKVDASTANQLLVSATVLTAPLYILFGWLSDRIGRKPVYLSGVILGAVLIIPLFQTLTHYSNPTLERALKEAPIVVMADPAQCSLQFNPFGTAKFTSSCDIAKGNIVGAGLNYQNQTIPAGATAQIKIGNQVITSYNGSDPDAAVKAKDFNAALAAALKESGLVSGPANPAEINMSMVLLVLIALLTFGTLTFAPTASMLIELFPSRIRYTALSFPYHLGVAWFGGFLPAIAFTIAAATGDIYSGLYYPALIAAISSVVVLLFAKETSGTDIYTH